MTWQAANFGEDGKPFSFLYRINGNGKVSLTDKIFIEAEFHGKSNVMIGKIWNGNVICSKGAKVPGNVVSKREIVIGLLQIANAPGNGQTSNLMELKNQIIIEAEFHGKSNVTIGKIWNENGPQTENSCPPVPPTTTQAPTTTTLPTTTTTPTTTTKPTTTMLMTPTIKTTLSPKISTKGTNLPSSIMSTTMEYHSSKTISKLFTTFHPGKDISTVSILDIIQNSTKMFNTNTPSHKTSIASTTNNILPTTLFHHNSNGYKQNETTLEANQVTKPSKGFTVYTSGRDNITSYFTTESSSNKFDELKSYLRKKIIIILASIFGILSVLAIIYLIVRSIRRSDLLNERRLV
ncbi:Hypothetical predicted protein [Octopus vulgaris]|uniref:Uncharacterized protein n=1 Tax=Octopus vulgaris TaxID=6645 RepID=A0AA36F320_OCTVU|nr:Hypothetical predicted protein [Octopus vulgaris]